VLSFISIDRASGNKQFSDLSSSQKLLTAIFTAALLVSLFSIVAWALLWFSDALKKQEKQKSKKKVKSSPYTMKMLASAGTFLILAGIVFNFGLLFWAGVIFGFMWANRYTTKYPRYRTAYQISLVIIIVLFLAIEVAFTYRDIHQYFL